MGDNLRIRKLKKALADTLNESLLPMEVKRMTLNELLTEVTQLAEQEVQKEVAQEQEYLLQKQKLQKEKALTEKEESEEKEDGIRETNVG